MVRRNPKIWERRLPGLGEPGSRGWSVADWQVVITSTESVRGDPAYGTEAQRLIILRLWSFLWRRVVISEAWRATPLSPA